MAIFAKVVRFLSLGVLVLGACGASPMVSRTSAIPLTGADPQELTPGLYLPLMNRSYPLQTLFGATLKPIVPEGGLLAMQEAGSQWVRIDMPWDVVQPTEGGPLRWDQVQGIDQQIINATSAGMEVILIIGTEPDWALKPGFSGCGPVAQNKFLALGSFLTQLIGRYSGQPYNVRYWELWNEPDLGGSLGCWGDASDLQYNGGAYYGEMLKVIYPHIKSINRNAQVLVGGLLMPCIPTEVVAAAGCNTPGAQAMSRFLEGILKSGAGNSFDGIGFHAYDWYADGDQPGEYANKEWNSSQVSGPSSIRKARYINDLLSQYGISGKYLLNTETALFCDLNEDKQTCDSYLNFKLTKAYYLVQSYTVALSEGWKANLWYTATGARGSGLLIGPQLTPEPAYYSFKFTRSMLQGATFTRRPAAPNGVFAYEFNRGDRLIWVLWSNSQAVLPVPLDRAPVGVYQIMGDGNGTAVPEPPPAGGSVQVGPVPVFVEFLP